MVINPVPVFADDWSRDGNWIAYTVNTTKAGTDLWLKTACRRHAGARVSQYPLRRRGRQVLPDSRWLAFASNETSDTPEVYVARVDQPAQRVRISSGGGTAPRWRSDGKELFYAVADGRTMMVAPIESLSPFRAGTPKRLFTLGVGSAATRDRVRNTDYDVAPDGQRFLISVPVGQAASSQTTIVLNWPGTLGR